MITRLSKKKKVSEAEIVRIAVEDLYAGTFND
jgi:hypothetical protein